jgi:outer membrane receptor protein involved in Fe transport
MQKPRYKNKHARAPKSSRSMLVTILMLLALCLVPESGKPAFAQATTGSIRGTIEDPAGAKIANAGVSAKNRDTGVESPRFKSTGDGFYVVPNLVPGTYTLIIQLQGFKRLELSGIEVKLGQDSVEPVQQLQPGGVQETVTVTASSGDALQSTSEISTSIDARRVKDLPMTIAGGGLDVLALLAPGVTPAFFSSVNSNGTALSVNGSRSRAVSFNIDGQDNNDQEVGGLLYKIDNPDTIADYQVVTGNFPAQFGRNSSGIINIVTKQGTNGFHGSAFYFYRDKSLFDSSINQQTAESTSRPFAFPNGNVVGASPSGSSGAVLTGPEQDNIFGGTIGGPIIKDRLFFFASYEGNKSRTGSITYEDDFLAILPAGLQELKSLYPSNPAVQAIARFSPFAITDLGTVSAAPGTQDTVTIGGRQFPAAFPQRTITEPFDENEFTGRIDFKISDRDSMWTRYLFQNPVTKNLASVFGGNDPVSGFTGDGRTTTQSVGSGWDRQLSGRAINSFTFAYSRFRLAFGGGCAGLTGCIADPLDDPSGTLTHIELDLPGNATFPGTTTPINQTEGAGPSNNLAEGRLADVFQFGDTVSLISGNHQFKFGTDIRRLSTTTQLLPFSNGEEAFLSADQLVANLPQDEFIGLGNSPNKWLETDQFYFLQDDWRVQSNLTLNLGVRYEHESEPINRLHDLTVQRESNPATALWETDLPPSDRTVPTVAAPRGNVAPRLGIAYTPHFWKELFGNEETVIRAGYTIAYDPAFYNILDDVAGSPPASMTLDLVPFPGANGTLLPLCANFGPGCSPSIPLPGPIPIGGLVQAAALRFLHANASALALNPGDAAEVQLAPNFHSPYTQQWTFGIQRKIKNSIVEARYIGNRGMGLFQTVDTNPPVAALENGLGSLTLPSGQRITFPGFPSVVPGNAVINPSSGRLLPEKAPILTIQNSGSSTYNALQTSYYGRLFNQLTLGAAYTFSKALDNSSDIFLPNNVTPGSGGASGRASSSSGFFTSIENTIAQDPFDTNNAEKSYSGFDRTHMLTLSAIWELPIMRGERGIVGGALGGWQLNGVYEFASGQRFTPLQAFSFPEYVDSFLPATEAAGSINQFGSDQFGFFQSTFARPFNGNPKASPGSVGISQVDLALLLNNLSVIQNPNGFYSLNAILQGKFVSVSPNQVRYIENGPGADRIFGTPYGDVTRNSLQATPINMFNAGLFKSFRLQESTRLQLRVDVFNVFNHPNPGYGDLEGDQAPPQFIESAGFNNRSFMIPAPRVLQFGLKFTF